MTIIDKNYDISQWCKQNKQSNSVKLLAINILRYMSKRSNVGVAIKLATWLKTFMEEWNGHNAFAHLLKFDEVLQ